MPEIRDDRTMKCPISLPRKALAACLAAVLSAGTALPSFAEKPDPDSILASLIAGNHLFMSGQSAGSHRNLDRRELAAHSAQGDYAQATILSCADSRVPVELLFNSGIMDLFVIRIAGNVCQADEVGTIEFGISHVHTPLLVVLGHSDCGAVKAVAADVQGHGHPLPKNVSALIAPIRPAVNRALAKHPDLHDAAIVPAAVEENVWQSIETIFRMSPLARDSVHQHRIKVVGGVYDLGTGCVSILPETTVGEILDAVESDLGRDQTASPAAL
jgi:carbonic anhydrase